MNLARREQKKQLYQFLSQSGIGHSILWGIVLVCFLLIDQYNHGFFFHFTNNLLRIIVWMVLVYYNQLYLIPNYLTKDKVLTYFLLLILSVLIITPIGNIIEFFKYTNYPEYQNFLKNNHHSYFLINFFVVGLSTIVKIVVDWAKHQRERTELQTQTMQSELRFLKSQINPHFLFNTLNNLYALTLKKSDKAPEIVVKLSEMMRYMLYECNEKRVSLAKEINYIKNYLDLEALRQGKGVEIRFEVQGEVINQKIAPLLFIPFLENSFKHGLNHAISEGFVHIVLFVEDNDIIFHIENSKPDTIPLPEHPRSGGIGLVNVRRRLNILYPDHHTLTVEDQPNIYSVDLKLELD